MELKDIAAVAGKPGLYRILKPTRSGVILETLDNKKKKIVTNVNYRVSVLKEISIYTTTTAGSVSLLHVFKEMKTQYSDNQIVMPKDNEALIEFIAQIVPDFDEDRVYPSDVKKLITWYNILSQYAPEIFEESEEEEAQKEVQKEAKKQEANA